MICLFCQFVSGQFFVLSICKWPFKTGFVVHSYAYSIELVAKV